MHAAGFGEEAGLERPGLCVPNDALATGAELSESPWDFTSSFFHIRHLDIENWIFEVAYRRAGREPRLRRVNIVHDLMAVNKNGG
jgi:hypothetical protein